MRPFAFAAALILAPLAPAIAGDSSGFDPAAIDQCLADTPDAVCAEAGMQFCLEYVEKEHPDVDAVDRQLGCLDASHQAWDARLTGSYDALVAHAAAKGAEAETAVREMERNWITFRDARCAMDAQLFGGGTGGATEQPRCLRDETARHAGLLARYVAETAQ